MGHGSGTCFLQAITPMFSVPSCEKTVTLRPAPWKTGPSGYIEWMRAPRK